MKGFHGNIEILTIENTDFRKVIYTTEKSQLVLMSIPPGEEIGNEVHEDNDQFLRFEQGEGKAILNNNEEYVVSDGMALVIPAGAWHNVMNTGKIPLKLYSVYSPAHHREGVIHKTKEDAENYDEDFDGKTTE